MLDRKVPARVLIAFFLILIIFSFAYFGIGFKPELRDNSWSLYWAYDYVNHGILEDRYIGNGLASLSITGLTPAVFYGHALNIIGWSLPHAIFLSSCLVLAALLLWSLFLKGKGWSHFSIFVFVAIGLLLDGYFEPAHTTKTDAFTFFMLTLSFFLFTKKRYLLAGFLAIICFESHPIGLTSFFYMLGYFLANRKNILKEHPIRPFLFFGAGIALGVAYYLYFHYNSLFNSSFSLEGNIDSNESLFYIKSYILKYFLPSGFSKHIPEFFMFFALIVVGVIKKFYRQNSEVYWIFLMVFLSSFLNPHPVHTYVIMAFPAIIMLAVDTAKRMNCQRLLLLYFFLLVLPQFMYLSYKKRDWPPHKAYVATIRENLPVDDSLPLIGSNNEWFACMERTYYNFTKLDLFPEFRPDTFFLIVENDCRKYNLPEALALEYSWERLNEFNNFGEKFEIYRMVKK